MKWSIREWELASKEPTKQTASYIATKLGRIGRAMYNTDVPALADNQIENILWEEGCCMVWRSPELGWVSTSCMETGYDINGVPNRWKPVFKTENGLSRPELSEQDDCVVFYDTMRHDVKRSDCLVLAPDYADVMETIRQQVFNQNTPLMAFSGNTSIRAKLKNMMVGVARHAKVMFVEESLKDKVTCLDFNAPYNVESLHAYKKSIENEMLEFMGVDNKDAFQKKERLVVDEQEGNDELLNYILNDSLKARQVACEKLIAKGLEASTEIVGLVRPVQMIEDGEDVDTETGQVQ